jgi:acyl-CoA thioester hydrolase
VTEPPVFEQAMGVYFDDLDSFGILHNSRFILLFERALGEFWTRRGLGGFKDSPDDLHLVRENTIEYSSPVRGVCRVFVQLWVEHLGRTSLRFGFRILSDDRAQEHARGHRTVVHIDAASLQSRPWTPEFRVLLAPWWPETHNSNERAGEPAPDEMKGSRPMNPNNLTVADVMTRDVIGVAPDTSRESAARLLTLERIGGAPVVTANGHVVGVVSITDLLNPDAESEQGEGHPVFYRILDGWAEEFGDAVDASPGRVDEVMTRGAITTSVDTTLVDAAQKMLECGIHRLLVVRDEKLTGMVTTIDLLRGFVDGAGAKA